MIKAGWKENRIEDLGTLKRGKSKHRPRNDPLLYGGPYPFIQTSDVRNSVLHIDSYEQTYSELGLKQSKLWEPGTLCMTIAGNVAETGILQIEACFPDSIVGFNSFKEKSDVRFIKYLIDYLKINYQNISKGTTQDNLSLDKISSIKLITPNVDIQKKIATIISNYDNLIENNEKRIKVIEQMANLIYKEWFVNFKFPGYEKIKMVDSKTELAMIPVDWKVERLSEVMENIVLGGTPSRSKEEYWNGAIPWIKSGELNNLRVIAGTENITELGLNKSATKLMPKRTVLIAITGAILISMSEIELCANQSVIGLFGSKNVIQEYLYLYQKENIQQFISKMSGSAQQHVNKEIVADSFILVPKKEIMDAFSKNIKPLFDEITNLIFKNQNLRKTRDLLLPKLISGEVEVSKLDIKITEEVANT